MRISDWSSDVCSSDLHDDEVRVAVARGKIIYNPRSAAIAVTPGEQLLDRADAGPLLTQVRPETVGSWKPGRLIYANAALSQVPADLGRSLGVYIAVAPAIADRAFSAPSALAQHGRTRVME